MARKKRFHAKGYRSGLEEKAAEQLSRAGIPYTYEEEKIKYTIPESEHTYTPDFVIKTKDGNKIYIETKGLWDAADRKKHLLIKQQHPDLDIRFVFSRSHATLRKGAKTTYADICSGKGRAPYKGITWKYADKTIPKEWLNE